MRDSRPIPEPPDFISRYINYIGISEAPISFHRWSAIAGLGTWLGRKVWFQHGNFKIYPNLYVQLCGSAGVRKSTSIKQFSKILRAAGFKDFSMEKTSKEKFIEWLADRESPDAGTVEESLWATIDNVGETNVLIAADEFNDFFSTNILDFLSFLGVMWDYEGDYSHSTRSGGTVYVRNPNISILSGNTPTTLAKTIPQEAIGQGFFSRVILVHGEPNGIKIAFPTAQSESATQELVDALHSIRTKYEGPLGISEDGIILLEQIYSNWKGLEDPRFAGYSNRRFNQLIKLSMIHCVAADADEIDIDHIVRANTVLTRAEKDMPKALGEFGTSRHAVASGKILSIMRHTAIPMAIEDLWARLHNDLDKLTELTEIVRGLLVAGKIRAVPDGFLPVIKVADIDSPEREEDITVDWDYLSEQEKVIKD